MEKNVSSLNDEIFSFKLQSNKSCENSKLGLNNDVKDSGSLLFLSQETIIEIKIKYFILFIISNISEDTMNYEIIYL